MRITVVTPDISSNAMARTCPIVETLQENHTVELIGFDHGNGFFEPYEGEFDYVAAPTGLTPLSLAKNINKLERTITGEVVYAFRPLAGSLGVALLHKHRQGTPVILDVEDILRFENYPIYKKLYNVIRYSGNPTFEGYSSILRRMTDNVDAVTVTSNYLADQYGGTVLPYGPDADEFDPSKVEPHPDLISRYEENRIIVFIGTIRPHKGLDILADALEMVPDDVRLVIAGYDPLSMIGDLRARSNGKADFLGPIPHADVPAYLQAANLIAIPQKQTRYTRAQIPQKVFEAMAMQKPIVASSTADLPKILKDSAIIVEPSDPVKLSNAINEILEHPDLSEKLGECARDRYLRKYSRAVLQVRLNDIIDSVKQP